MLSLQRQACRWDATEVLLKASLQSKEDSLLSAWVRGYEFSFAPCYPRLHVIADNSSLTRAKHLFFRSTPNVSFHANNFAPTVEKAGKYWWIQWHILWADNFTTAEYVFFFDVDATPVLPLRCQHLFDDDERLRIHAFRYDGNGTHWVMDDSRVFTAAAASGAVGRSAGLDGGETTRILRRKSFSETMAHLDFMTYWPIVAPRWVLSHLRALVTVFHRPAANGGARCFDEAFVGPGTYSHADLLGKSLMLLFPDRVRLTLCPSVHNRSAHDILSEMSTLARDHQRNGGGSLHRKRLGSHHATRGATSQHGHGGAVAVGSNATAVHAWHDHEATIEHVPCLDRVNPVEHVRHPLQGLHSPSAGVRYKSMPQAAEYAHALINASERFSRGEGPIPPYLFAYGQHPAPPPQLRRSPAAKEVEEANIALWLRRDDPGRVCGVSRRTK